MVQRAILVQEKSIAGDRILLIDSKFGIAGAAASSAGARYNSDISTPLYKSLG
jgi:hypothetical protein